MKINVFKKKASSTLGFRYIVDQGYIDVQKDSSKSNSMLGTLSGNCILVGWLNISVPVIIVAMHC